MSSQRYQRVNAHDDDDHNSSTYTPNRSQPNNATPSSPPPSFRSRSSSRSRWLLQGESQREDPDQTLADTFGDGSDSEGDDEPDDRQRLMRANPQPQLPADSGNGAGSSAAGARDAQQGERRDSTLQRRTTEFPSLTGGAAAGPGRVISSSNDGVFANLAAKPERGEKNEDLPPSYEEAAADATPPYWETTILAPGLSSDEVFVDGLPVGSIFSFVWNAMISMSFQLVGFLLTYLLHTTHAAKNGSRAGLGLTLVQYGFYMKGGSDPKPSDDTASDQYVTPSNPNSHNFDPDTVADNGGGGGASDGGVSAISTGEWISYILMIVGWFILIRAISDFLRARRHEQLVLQSPGRGLSVPVIAEGERAETVV